MERRASLQCSSHSELTGPSFRRNMLPKYFRNHHVAPVDTRKTLCSNFLGVAEASSSPVFSEGESFNLTSEEETLSCDLNNKRTPVSVCCHQNKDSKSKELCRKVKFDDQQKKNNFVMIKITEEEQTTESELMQLNER